MVYTKGIFHNLILTKVVKDLLVTGAFVSVQFSSVQFICHFIRDKI